MDALTKLLTRLAQDAPKPGVPCSQDQLALLVAEAESALAGLPVAERAAVMRDVMSRAKSGDEAHNRFLGEKCMSLELTRVAGEIRLDPDKYA